MNPHSSQLSLGLKAAGIGLLALLLCIPLLAVRGLLAERETRLREAGQEIARAWSGPQTVGGPLLRVALRREEQDEQGRPEARSRQLALLPDRLDIDARTVSEVRRRGLFRVPVYTAQLALRGQWTASDLAALAPEAGETLYGAELLLPLADLRGVRSVDGLEVGGRERRFTAAAGELGGLSLLRVELEPEAFVSGALDFSVRLHLAGVERLLFLPLARQSSVNLAGDWPHPSFEGAFLPVEREVGPEGHAARWQVLEIHRGYAQRWTGARIEPGTLAASAFGVAWYQPADAYQQNARALKYGFLFVLLTFAAFWLGETLLALRVHPIQYLLVGAALVAFFLLLLALSEHIAFALAYALSAVTLVAMVGGYSAAALGAPRRGALMGAFMAMLYLVLFLLIRSESYALLLGAWLVLALIAAAMYLTRRVDWYRPAIAEAARRDGPAAPHARP
jgi:inner membrane protein